MKLLALATLSFLISVANVWADPNVGILTQAEGMVEIYSHPSKSIEGPAPRAKFQGEYYTVRAAKTGDAIEQGNIVRTAVNSKARVIFENGDQINVAPGTAYRVHWNEGDEAKTKMELMHGRLRSIVSKTGPRKRMTVRTRTATMGVRGTDFYVADLGPGQGTEVSVLRGAVEVKPEAAKAKAVKVEKGFAAAVVKESSKASTPAAANVRKLTQGNLIDIQVDSTVKVEPRREISQQTESKIKTLEQKAAVMTLTDIKEGDPQLYSELKKTEGQRVDAVNTAVVKTLLTQAPPGRPRHTKPQLEDLEALGGDAYEKYLK